MDSDRHVVLERGYVVRLVLSEELPELPGGWVLEGRLDRACSVSPSFAPAVTRGIPFTGRAASAWVSETGDYEFGYDLVLRDAEKELVRASFDLGPATTLQVIHTPLPHLVRVPSLSSEQRDAIPAFIEALE